MNLNYKQKLFFYFSVVITLFGIGTLVFEQNRGKAFRINSLEEKLETYTEIVNASLQHQNNKELGVLDSLLLVFPQNIRLSLIDTKGQVVFDNEIEDLNLLENHADRAEITKALKQGKGSDIRTSSSNQLPYLYFAKKYANHYVRVALPYNSKTQLLLETDYLFFSFVLVLLGISILTLYFITKRFGKSIKKLRDFALNSDTHQLPHYKFPNDELGEIGAQIAENYRKLKISERSIHLEKEKLLQHVQSSEEGICFFSKDKEVEFFNGLFIQYLNILTDEPSRVLSSIFTDPIFAEVNEFLEQEKEDYLEIKIQKQAKVFSLRLNIFEDKSFEIILNDISIQEKTKRLKQEMTSNIAHELRTPITSIRGYLETALNLPLEEEKKESFITKAYDLSMLLSETIQDMGLITSLEEAPHAFKTEEVDINNLLDGLKSDLKQQLEEKDINLDFEIPKDLRLAGNPNLLYSIFRNLADNAIRYAGNSIEIRIKMYHQDKDFYYFSFYDTGVGIKEVSHFNRLFERFYRVNEGRTRDTGGTGLGLSIVKNAVLYHQGKISVRNRKEGGLEFLFQLKSH